MPGKSAVKSPAVNLKRTNLFVVGVVLTYFGYTWFWTIVNYDVSLPWLWGVVTTFIALLGLFLLGRAIFDE